MWGFGEDEGVGKIRAIFFQFWLISGIIKGL